MKEDLELKPAFDNKNIAIGMSSSNEYLPYLSVCLKSLVDNSSDDYNYDIVIFEREISDKNKDVLKQFIQRKNISLRFINPVPILEKYKLIYPKQYVLESFFRLASPIIFKKYEKIIFTDIDLIFQGDIKDLYNIDLEGHPIGACTDLIMMAFLNMPQNNHSEYCKNVLGLKNLEDYVNAGVILLDINKFTRNNYTQKLLAIADGFHFKMVEQDVLNKFFEGNIKFLNQNWNTPILTEQDKHFYSLWPQKFQEKYDNAFLDPKIFHRKSWMFPEEEYSEIWWQYARKSPFYEIILKRLIEQIANVDLVKETFKYKTYLSKYRKYKILSKITFGKTHKKYNEKCVDLKQKVRKIRDFLYNQ